MSLHSEIESVLSEITGEPFRILKRHPIGGGCISRAACLEGHSRRFFLKTNQPDFLERFEQESDSLAALAASHSIKVPQPLATGLADDCSYLVLEYIPIGTAKPNSWSRFGQQLAALHQAPQSCFGWHRDNAIGATPQPNAKSDRWIDFFRERRLRHQMTLCQAKGLNLPGGERLLDQLPGFFEDHDPQPSLLHGDLWSGNAAFDAAGEPFLFDPCCYFGDRETDLAFTEFFGGFHSDFYAAYHEALPLAPGYALRKHLYNLYHCLNHYVLFGGGYGAQAQAMVDGLLAHLK